MPYHLDPISRMFYLPVTSTYQQPKPMHCFNDDKYLELYHLLLNIKEINVIVSDQLFIGTCTRGLFIESFNLNEKRLAR